MRKNLDKILCLSILLILITFVIIIFFSTITWFKIFLCVNSILVIIVILWYFADLSRSPLDKTKFNIQKINYSFYMIYDILFVLFIGCIFVILNNVLYERPLIYFVLVSTISILLIFECIHSSNYKKVLIKIIILALVQHINLWLLFPGVIGGDTFYHYGLYKFGIIQESLFNNKDFWYSDYPIFHLVIIMFSKLSFGSSIAIINYKYSLLATWCLLIQISSCLIIYNIGKTIIHPKVGLISAIALPLFPYFKWYTIHLAPYSAAVLLLLFLLMITIKMINTQNKIYFIIIWMLLVFAIIHAHPLIMLFLLFFILIFSVSSKIFNYNNNIPVLIVFVSIIAKWIYFANNSFNPIEAIYDSIINLLNYLKSPNLSGIYTNTNLNVASEVLDSLGMAIFFSLSFLGFLKLIFKDDKQIKLFSSIAIVFCVLLVVMLNPQLGKQLVVYRLIGIGFFFLVIYYSSSIIYLYTKYKNVYGKIALIMALFIALFLANTNSLVNIDNPIYNKNKTIRWAYKLTEIRAAEHIWFNSENKNIYYDKSYLSLFRYYPFIDNKQRDINKLQENKSVTVIREYIFKRPIYTDRGIAMLSNNKINKIKYFCSKSDSIYSNGKVKNVLGKMDKIKIFDNSKV